MRSLRSSRLMITEPIATPTEKIASTTLAVAASAVSTFFTKGGKITISTEPIVQKKLIAQMARNSRGMCSVLALSRSEAAKGLISIFSDGPTRVGLVTQSDAVTALPYTQLTAPTPVSVTPPRDFALIIYKPNK